MLLVKTSIKASPHHGFGLFAEEKILKGARTWLFVEKFDVMFDDADLSRLRALSPAAAESVENFLYQSPVSKLFILCGDNARYMNHSEDPNTSGGYSAEDPEGFDIATRDIEIGEELTCNYKTFDLAVSHKGI
ncbi:MAG: SET domain-containing protein-lysine N-methyltransferase [Proteobacteria bacterium]|nr:MAG: SET domain-containing protein-lysine N-methyltransferase [Pseudomonadota bacterium]